MSKDLALQQTEWDLHENPESFIPLEFTEEIKPELYGLEAKEANQLVGGIDVITAELKVLKDAYIDVIELEINTENLPVFKDLRKNFSKNRTSREKLRKAKKSYFLNGGRFVDAIFKNIDAECDLMESKLLGAEKYFENLEKQKAKELNDARIAKISPYLENAENMNFAEFSDEDFDDFVEGKKARFEKAKEEAEAEALRIETERLKTIETNRRRLFLVPYSIYLDLSHLDISELSNEEFDSVLEDCKNAKIEFDKQQEKIRVENARLKKEVDDAKAKADKLEADNNAKLEAQRIENKRLAKELQDKQDAENKAELGRLADLARQTKEAEKLAKAPIKIQLENWVNSFEIPECTVQNATSKEISEKFEAFKKWSLTQVNNL